MASMTTFGLFVFMAFLISSDKVVINEPLPDIRVEVMSLPDEKPPEEKPNALPTPPTTPPPPLVIKEVSPADGVGDNIEIDVPNIDMPTGGTNTLQISAPKDNAARPVVRISPKYPRDAAMNGTEGWVVLSFNINTIGEVVDITVVESQPKRVFDQAAKKALKRWKYKAKMVDGKAVMQESLSVQLDFSMNQTS